MSAPLLLLALIVAPAATPEDWTRYEQLKAAAGRDPDAHVNLALWCESKDLPAQRDLHLSQAVLIDPENIRARGLLGQVKHLDRWLSPEKVVDRLQSDPDLSAKLADYEVRRAGIDPQSASDHAQLAAWCASQGLEPESIVHNTAAIRLDPSHESAWRALGFVKKGNRWLRPGQEEEERQLQAARKGEFEHWKPILSKYRDQLSSKSDRMAAEESLRNVDSPAAVNAVWDVFATGTPAAQQIAVQLFGQIDAPAASRALATMAVMADDPAVRRASAESLVHRDTQEVVTWLIGLIRKPARYEVRPPEQPGQPGVLYVEGERFNLQRFYQAPPPPDQDLIDFETALSRNPAALLAANRVNAAFYAQGNGIKGDQAGNLAAALAHDPANPARAVRDAQIANQATNAREIPPDVSFEMRFLSRINAATEHNRAQYAQAVASVQIRFNQDVAMIEQSNQAITLLNDRVLPVLNAITEQRFGNDRIAWEAWWTDQKGYAYSPPTIPDLVQNLEVPLPPFYLPTPRASSSCFAAGTLVQTAQGEQRIETIHAGTRVLSLDAATGSLGFQPVLAVYHNKPAETLTLHFDGSDEIITATTIHRFWVSGAGWTMTRDLQPGQTLRTANGLATLATIDRAPVQPVYNLEVADTHAFFVGRAGYLVHDHSIVEPVTTPFDRPIVDGLLAATPRTP